MMKMIRFKCKKEFGIYFVEDGGKIITIKEGSVWWFRRSYGDEKVQLDSVDDGRPIEINFECLCEFFEEMV